MTDLEWDAFFEAMATPKLIRYEPTRPLGACSLLKEALQPPS
jgi:hypothetical protein